MQTFSSCSKQGPLLVAVHGFSLRWLLGAEHRLWASGLLCSQLMGSVVVVRGLQGARASLVVVHRLSCSTACRIFLDQGSNWGPLHWQTDSYLLYHQRSPEGYIVSYIQSNTNGFPEKKKQKKKPISIIDVFDMILKILGEGNGNPLQYSCLENPRDRGT